LHSVALASCIADGLRSCQLFHIAKKHAGSLETTGVELGAFESYHLELQLFRVCGYYISDTLQRIFSRSSFIDGKGQASLLMEIRDVPLLSVPLSLEGSEAETISSRKLIVDVYREFSRAFALGSPQKIIFAIGRVLKCQPSSAGDEAAPSSARLGLRQTAAALLCHALPELIMWRLCLANTTANKNDRVRFEAMSARLWLLGLVDDVALQQRIAGLCCGQAGLTGVSEEGLVVLKPTATPSSASVDHNFDFFKRSLCEVIYSSASARRVGGERLGACVASDSDVTLADEGDFDGDARPGLSSIPSARANELVKQALDSSLDFIRM